MTMFKDLVADCIELGYQFFILDEDYPDVEKMILDAGCTVKHDDEWQGYIVTPDSQLTGINSPVV